MPSSAAGAQVASTIPDIDNLPDGAYLTRAQLAPLVGISVPSLKRWAAEGRGPRITRVENRPRFRVSDVRDWLAGDGADA